MTASERTRSFWGWGYTDRFPDEATRAGMATMVRAVIGSGDFAPRPLPQLDSIDLPPPRLEIPAPLAALSSTSRLDRASHCYGKGYRDLVRGFAGDYRVAPDAVCRPEGDSDIEKVLEWASKSRVAVIPYGGGTSVVGGVEGAVGAEYNGVVSLDLGQLRRVVEVDDVSRAARIQAGAAGPDLESQLGDCGFTLRHFPQSFEFSTLGGWVATRAGGHFATIYTHIDDLVESVRMITPSGVWQTRRLPGSGAGPSPDRAVIGSEGILGVITEAWMRVQVKPRYRASASVRFSDWERAVDATRELAQSGLYPANARLLDKHEARLHQVAMDGSHVLIIGFESADHELSAWIERALAIARGHGGECPDGPAVADRGQRTGDRSEAGAWKTAFIEAPYLGNALISLGCVVDTFETACTWSQFGELHRAVRAAVRAAMSEHCGGGIVACRFTHVYPDGPAPYYTFIAPGRAGAELEQWAAVKQAASDAILAAGGTITHHHAVGRVHRPWYDRQRPELFARGLAAQKRALDPAWVLNPGVLIDP